MRHSERRYIDPQARAVHPITHINLLSYKYNWI